MKGNPIFGNDIWIAAICRSYGIPLYTLDKHFVNIPGLDIFKNNLIDMKILGCSLEAEFWKCDPDWEHISISEIGTFEIPPKIILEYLQGGIPLLAKRTTIYCKLTGEDIGTPILWTDGFFCWMTSYTFYISKGMIQLDSVFLSHMENVNFINPPIDSIDRVGILEFFRS